MNAFSLIDAKTLFSYRFPMSGTAPCVFLSIGRIKGGAEKYLENLHKDYSAEYPGAEAGFRHLHLGGRIYVPLLAALLSLPKGTVVYNMSVLGVYIAPLILLKLMGRRIVLYPHIVTDHRTLASRFPAVRNLFRSLCLKLADAVVLISDGNREVLGIPGIDPKFSFVYNYVNCENGLEPAPRLDRNLAIIGRFQNRHKRQLQFLERFGADCKALGITVHLFGDGEDGAAIRALIAKLGLQATVALHGWVPEEEMFRKPFGFVLCYSEWEGLPLNVLESIYRDKVVLGKDIPGVREIVHPAFRFSSDEGLRTLLREAVAGGKIDAAALREQKAAVFAKYSRRKALGALRSVLAPEG